MSKRYAIAAADEVKPAHWVAERFVVTGGNRLSGGGRRRPERCKLMALRRCMSRHPRCAMEVLSRGLGATVELDSPPKCDAGATAASVMCWNPLRRQTRALPGGDGGLALDMHRRGLRRCLQHRGTREGGVIQYSRWEPPRHLVAWKVARARRRRRARC